jgi:ankyrin repeat protein
MSVRLRDAAERGRAEIIRAYRNPDWSDRDRFGATALMLASGNGHAEAVRALLEIGAPVGDMDDDGATALHYAARLGHREIVNALIAAGAEVDALDRGEWESETPLCFAARGGHIEVVEALLKAGAEVPYGPVREAVERGDKEMTLLLTWVREQRWQAQNNKT